MKKALLLATGLMAGLTTYTNAQEVDSACRKADLFIGPTLGAGSTWVDRMGPRKEFKMYGTIGISFLYSREQHIGWGADLVVSAEGYKRSDVTKEHKVLSTESVTPIY